MMAPAPCRQYSLKPFFTNSDAVRALTLCLNDVVPHVRLAALTMLGRLARLNPAAATPVLRRCLEQLLTDIEHCPDSRRLDDSTMLLAEMIRQVRLARVLGSRRRGSLACFCCMQSIYVRAKCTADDFREVARNASVES